MAIPQSPVSQKLEDIPLELFRCLLTLHQQRIMLQNKCVELSVQVTAGLAFAVIGGVIALIDKRREIGEFGILIFSIFCFYGFIQAVILTNYIYHAFCVGNHNYAFDPQTKKVIENVRSHISVAKRRPRLGIVAGIGLPCVKRLQAFVIYASIGLGLLVMGLELWGPLKDSFFGILPRWRTFLKVVFFVLAGFDICLLVLHSLVPRFAKEFVNSHLAEAPPPK